MAAQERKTVKAPCIEVVLTPAAGQLYDAWLVLHVPDGKRPTTVPLDGGPFDRDAAVELLLSIYTTLGEKFATVEAQRGMLRSPPKN
jgi:hypothetical protein